MARELLLTQIEAISDPDELERMLKHSLYDGDGFLGSGAHRRAVRGEDGWWHIADIAGYLVVKRGGLAETGLDEIFHTSDEFVRGTRGGYGCANFCYLLDIGKSRFRVDLMVSESSWSVRREDLAGLGINIKEEMPLLERPIVYSAWRRDFSQIRPKEVVILKKPLPLLGVKEQYSKF